MNLHRSHYQIVKLIGEGAQGRVYFARQGERRLALKILHAAADPRVLAWFREEARVLSRLSHPHVVKIHGFYETAQDWEQIRWPEGEALRGPRPFMVMDYIEGKSLDEIPQSEAMELGLDWFRQALVALQHLHAHRILHRDLKPQNLRRDAQGQLVLLDLGLAREMSSVPEAKTPMGTLAFLAPEVFMGDYDARSDLFSLALSFYKIIGGTFAFARPLTASFLQEIKTPAPLSSLRPEVSEYFSDLLQWMLRLSPTERPESATAVLRYLNRHQGRAADADQGVASLGLLEKAPWVGRETELRHFAAWLERASKQPFGAFWALRGPTGVGRSRLVEEWKWRAMLAQTRFLQLGPEAAGRFVALALERAGEVVQGDFLADSRTLLAALEKKANVLVFTDLHRWKLEDLRALSLLLSLAKERAVPLCVVVEYDSDLMPPQSWQAFEAISFQVMELADFSRAETEALLQRLGLASQDFSLEKIFSATAGRPLLVVEALRGVEKDHIPNNVRESCSQRVDSLSAEAKRLLALVLCHAQDPSCEQVREMAEGLGWDFFAGLDELERRNFLRGGLGVSQLSLSHPSLREVFIEALPRELLLQAHCVALRFLESHRDTSEPQVRQQLLEHAEVLRDREALLKWAIPGLLAMEALGHFEALSHMTEVLAAWEDPDLDRAYLFAIQAPNYYRLGRFAEASVAYRLWYRERCRGGDPEKLLEVRHHFYQGLVALGAGDAVGAKRELHQSVSTGDSSAHAALRPFQARAFNLLGSMAQKAADWREALQCFDRSLELAKDSPGILGETQHGLGLIHQRLGHFSLAETHFLAALSHYEQSGQAQAQAIAQNSLAMLYREAGQLRRAGQHIETALALARRGGEILQLARYEGNRALLDQDGGNFRTALQGLETLQKVLALLGKEEDRQLNRWHLASLHVQMGNFAEAEKFLQSLSASSLDPLRAERSWLTGDYRRAEYEAGRCLPSVPSDSMDEMTFAAALTWLKATFVLNPEFNCLAAVKPWLEFLKQRESALEAAWGEIFISFTHDPDKLSQEDFNKLIQRIGEVENLPARLDMLYLTALHYFRSGYPGLAEKIYEAAREDWVTLSKQLPQELIMDFEKNRSLRSLEEAMKAPGSAPYRPEPEAASPSGVVASSEPRISEARFRHFCEISRQIAAKSDLDEILERVMDAAIELSGAERGFLLLKDEATTAGPFPGFQVKTARHLNQTSLSKEEVQISFSAVKAAMDQGTPLLTDNAQQDARFQEMRSVVQYQIKSILVVPLESEGKVLGAIYLDHRYEPESFTKEDIVMLSGFASQAALALQKARMIAELQTHNHELLGQVQNQAQHIDALAEELTQARQGLKYEYEEIIGKSALMIQVFKQLDHVSRTRIPVWIHGESGTGKELIARSLHTNSPRKSGPFVSENCGAIPENLLESELFGFKKGAFTHADRDRVGLFELANGGTLFLDEVADMPMGMQIKLLRVLQEGEVRPLGSNKKVQIDVRLVTASNKDLQQLVKQGKFRQDLFFRINGLTLRLPALRHRREDIPLLVHHFVKRICKEYDLKAAPFSKDALDYLMEQNWPGNIRELEGVIRNVLLFSDGKPITRKSFIQAAPPPPPMDDAVFEVEAEEIEAAPKSLNVEQKAERRELVEAFVKCKMDKKAVAQELGITLKTVYARMARYGVPKKKNLLKIFLEEHRLKS